jgi:hypothetical protein
LLSQTDITSQEDSFLQDSPDNECSDSPVRRIAGSLGCDQQSSEWVITMETPTNTTRQDREQLNLVERNTLLPAELAENKSNPEINISRAITVSVKTSTTNRERMLSSRARTWPGTCSPETGR